MSIIKKSIKDGQVDHLMLLVDLLLMSWMAMSTNHLEVHVDLDDPYVEEEDAAWSTLMLSIPMMKLSVKMDRWSLLLPVMGDGQQAACALLPCENRWVIPGFLFQDGSEGEVDVLLDRHPGLHYYCQ